MAALEALAIGLSIAFGGLVLVLLAELFYIFVWKKYGILSEGIRRIGRIGTEFNRGIGNFANEAALVGSFGGYSASLVNTDFIAKLPPMGSEAIDRSSMFMDGVFGDPRLLFTIKEETEEDMESAEEPVKQDKESAAIFLPVQTLQSESLKLPSESSCPKQQQLLQRQFPHSIGVFQQPQILRSPFTKSTSWIPTATQQQNVLQGPSESSVHSSISLSSSPPHLSYSSSPSSPTSSSISPTPTSPNYQALCSSGSSSLENFCVSNPVYDPDFNEVSCNTQPNAFSEENEIEAACRIQSSGCPSPHETETPFDTPITSPSLLSPCVSPPMTPRLTPMKASKNPCGISIEMANHRSATNYTSSAESDPFSSSSKCSSPSSESCQESPTFHRPKKAPRRQSRPPPMLVPSYPNTTRKSTIMERRAFASLFNRPFLQSLPLG